jgi:hypothetical protein
MDGWMNVMWWRPTLSMFIFTIINLHLWGGKVWIKDGWMDEGYVVEAYLINGHFHHHHPSSLGRKSMDG